jgi:tetratricopeptide (TPR) repeat protein
MARAVDYFTSALKADPKHFESHFNLAHLYFEAGDYRLAELHYEISAVLEPHTASVYFNLALVYALQGGLEAALESLGKAREYATEEEIGQVEELLEGITKSLMEKQPADGRAESPAGKLE